MPPSQYVIATVDTNSLGMHIPPAAGYVPTALGNGGVTWQAGCGNGVVAISAGAGIALGGTSSNPVVINSSPASDVRLTSSGGEASLIANSSGPVMSLVGLTAGVGIGIVPKAGELIISSTAPVLSAGAGIDVSVNNGVATITATDAGAGVTLSSTGGTPLVVDGVGPALAIRGLAAGAGIELAQGEMITISSTAPTLAAGAGIDVTVADGVATITATDVTLASVGGESSTSLVSDGVGPALEIMGLAAGTGIELGVDGGNITIASTAPTLAAGAGIDVTVADGIATITATDAGAGVTLSSTGDANSTSLVGDGVGPALAMLGLAAGTGVELSVVDGSVVVSSTTPTLAAGAGIAVTVVDGIATITATDAGAGVTLASVGEVGSTSLVSDGVGPALSVLGLAAGPGIALGVTDSDVTISSTEPTVAAGAGISITVADGVATVAATNSGISISSMGGVNSTSLIGDGVGPAFTMLGLAAGAGIALEAADGVVTVSSTVPATAVSLASAGGDVSMVIDGVGPALTIQGLAAGAGIGLTSADGAITISSTSAFAGGTGIEVTESEGVFTIATTAPDVSLVSAGEGTSLVSDGVGPTLAICSLVAGDGVAVTAADGAITLANTSPASSVTLSPAEGATGVSAIGNGAGASLTIRNFVAGTNIVITASGTGDLVISGAAAQAGIDNLAGSGGASMDMSQPDRINLDGIDVFYPSMPNATWAQTAASDSVVYEANETLLLAIPCTPDVQIGFTTDENGTSTFDAGGGRPARRCQVTYRLSVKPEADAVGMLRYFVSVNGSPISLNRCEYAYAATTSTIPMSISAKLLLSSNDTVQLASELTGDAQTVVYSAMSCDISGLLNDA